MSRACRLLMGVGLSVLVMIAAVGPAVAVPNNRVDQIRGQGSDTTIDLMQNLDRAYNTSVGCVHVVTAGVQRLDHECVVQGPPFTSSENWDHDVAMSFFPLGSSSGIRMLSNFGIPGNARIDYARSSRARSGSDSADLRFVAYARDALTWVNFRGSVDPATCDVDRSGGPSGQFHEYDDSGPLAISTNNGTWPDGPDADTCNDATVASSVSNLTQQQVKDIHLNCTANTWDDLDNTKPAVPIIVWTSQPGSGTRGSWDGFVGGSTDQCIPANFKDGSLNNGERVIFEHDATPIVVCASDPDGAGPAVANCPDLAPSDGFDVHYTQSIYHYGFGAHSVSDTVPLGQGSDLGAIDGVQPTPATIDAGTFPYSRFVYNVYRNSFPTNNAPDFARDYIGEKGWICKLAGAHGTNPKTGNNYRDDIAQVIANTGFVPLPADPIGGGVTGDSHCRVS